MKNSNYRFHSVKLTLFIWFTVIVITYSHCSSDEKYYRPNLPERLCSIGFIDADDTSNYDFSIRDILDVRNSTRYITFEKSFQSEFSDDNNDSLSDFVFGITTKSTELFSFQQYGKMNSPAKFELPDSLVFKSDETYYLNARVGDLPEISAFSKVPDPPDRLLLKSVEIDDVQFHLSTPCRIHHGAKSAVFDFMFTNSGNTKKYYMILLVTDGLFDEIVHFSGPYDFSVIETNTPGFHAEVFGLNTLYWKCIDNQIGFPLSQISGYFIAGDNIPNKNCQIKLSVQYHNGIAPLERLDHVQIKLLSIPEEFYLFEKNLHNYTRVLNDPFSEPVYIGGNIVEGNGIFAICRSTSINVDLTTF